MVVPPSSAEATHCKAMVRDEVLVAERRRGGEGGTTEHGIKYTIVLTYIQYYATVTEIYVAITI